MDKCSSLLSTKTVVFVLFSKVKNRQDETDHLYKMEHLTLVVEPRDLLHICGTNATQDKRPKVQLIMNKARATEEENGELPLGWRPIKAGTHPPSL